MLRKKSIEGYADVKRNIYQATYRYGEGRLPLAGGCRSAGADDGSN